MIVGSLVKTDVRDEHYRYDTDRLADGERYNGFWYREKVEDDGDVVRTYLIRDVWHEGTLVTCQHQLPTGEWMSHPECGYMSPTRIDW